MNIITWMGLASIVFVVAFTANAYGGDQSGCGQTRRESIIEAWFNTLVGFVVNFTANLFLLPLVGAKFTLMENLFLGFIYTSISIVRSYAIRRFCNNYIHQFAVAAARKFI